MKILSYVFSAFLFFSCHTAFAGTPLWTFTPLTTTTITVPTDSTAIVQYQVTNQSSKSHTLKMQAIPSITQLTNGAGICGATFTLAGKASCTLSLQVNGSALTTVISGGPVVCEQGSSMQCYQPSAVNSLNITPVAPSSAVTLSVSGSPLTLNPNGSGNLTITNTSSTVSALNITSNFSGTALDGNVFESGNTCAYVPPLGSCSITYVANNTLVSLTSFPIQGTNTNAISAAIEVVSGASLSSINPSSGSASGGTGFTLSGSGLTGATSVTFDGIAATSLNVVNSTTVTGVTPAHAVGSVDIAIDTPSGNATLPNGYTYTTTAVGQPAFGGIIACLNPSNNLIAAVADNSVSISWGGMGSPTGATSNTDGEGNTTAIVSAIGAGSYAAELCDTYEVDSQGNTPCQAGNTCYNNWFLPAGNNTLNSGQLNCLYSNRVAIGGFSASPYWSSTEANANNAYQQNFLNGTETTSAKTTTIAVRCVRTFTP